MRRYPVGHIGHDFLGVELQLNRANALFPQLVQRADFVREDSDAVLSSGRFWGGQTWNRGERFGSANPVSDGVVYTRRRSASL